MLGQEPGFLIDEDRMQTIHDWLRLGSAHIQAVVVGQTLGPGFDVEQALDCPQDGAGQIRIGRLDLDELPAGMRPAPGAAKILIQDDPVVPAVGIGQ